MTTMTTPATTIPPEDSAISSTLPNSDQRLPGHADLRSIQAAVDRATGPQAHSPNQSHGRCGIPDRAGLPHPKAWSIHLARAAMEVLCGHRTSPQLVGWATLAAIDELTTQSPSISEPGRVRSVRAVAVGPAQLEVVVTVECGQRVRALALRLQGVRIPARPRSRHAPGPRWMATSMRLL